jgi:hypothetical protein
LEGVFNVKFDLENALQSNLTKGAGMPMKQKGKKLSHCSAERQNN